MVGGEEDSGGTTRGRKGRVVIVGERYCRIWFFFCCPLLRFSGREGRLEFRDGSFADGVSGGESRSLV